MRHNAISFLVLSLGLTLGATRASAQDYGKLNACVMWADGKDAAGWANEMSNGYWPYHHPELNVYASVRAIASMDASQGCDAIVSFRDGTRETTFDIFSGLTKQIIAQGPPEGWHIRGQVHEQRLAELLRPGGETYNALIAEKTADCAGGPSQYTPFCTAVAQRAQQEKEAKESAARAAVQAAAAREAQQAASMEESIRAQIPAWRAQKAKPAMPQEARKFRLLAEDAVQEKRFADAADYYEKALAIYPLWPEGHFNAATLQGELRRFGRAASHMRLYVELAPKAKDVQLAQDKIMVWEEKAKSQ